MWTLLLQNQSGQPEISLMNGTAVSSQALVGANPGAAWHVIGVPVISTATASRYSLAERFRPGRDLADERHGGVESGHWWAAIRVSSWHVKGAGDFAGDGHADILWQNDDGQAAIWFMNGTTTSSQTLAGSNPGPSWHIRGVGDFNGDGHADILWQNDNGQADIWLMNGANVVNTALAGSNPRHRLACHRDGGFQRRRQFRHHLAK